MVPLLGKPIGSPPLAWVGLLAGLGIGAPAGLANSHPVEDLDLEPWLRAAALVIAVRVDERESLPVVSGGKVYAPRYQYTFAPIRVLKGVYSRPRLLLTNGDLSSYSGSFDPRDIRRGERRLLVLRRSPVGYGAFARELSADLAFPRLEGPDDPLLGAVDALLAHQELSDRHEIVTRLSRDLGEAEGRGAIALLAALDRRAYVAAQVDAAFMAVGHQLGSADATVREAAAHVLGNLLQADYLENRNNREAAVAALVASLHQTETSLGARVAAIGALAAAADAVAGNEDAMRLVSLDTPYETLAEFSARLEVLGRVHQGRGAAPGIAGLLAELPLDAPGHLQRAVARSWARITSARGADRLFERMRRKHAIGLGRESEIEAFGQILPNVPDPWPLQRALLELGLTSAEKEAFVRASRWAPTPELAPALGDMLDPRRVRLRRLAAELLMEIDTKAAAQALRPHMGSERDLVRKLRFAAFLGRHGFDDGYPFAIEHLSEPRYLEAALEAIVGIAKPGTAEQLLDVYASSNDSGWKRAAVRGLGLLGHTAFAEELVALTRDRKHPLAAAALLARADLGDVDVIELLPAALASRSQAVVIAAARAAARLLPEGDGQGNEEAIRTALAALARDAAATEAVRRKALEALVVAEDDRLDEVLTAMLRDVRLERTELLTRVRELLRDRKVRM